MDDVHMPSAVVPSGPRSEGHATNGNSDGPKSIFELMAEKDLIESELSALSDILDSVRNLLKKAVNATDYILAWCQHEH